MDILRCVNVTGSVAFFFFLEGEECWCRSGEAREEFSSFAANEAS